MNPLNEYANSYNSYKDNIIPFPSSKDGNLPLKNNETYRLYIFIRNDLDSMTKGRTSAQVCHAGVQFSIQFERNMYKKIEDLYSKYLEWIRESSRKLYGTTIVLNTPEDIGFNISKINEIFSLYAKCPFYIDYVFDDDYQIYDGVVPFSVGVETCIYLFCAIKDYDTFKENVDCKLY